MSDSAWTFRGLIGMLVPDAGAMHVRLINVSDTITAPCRPDETPEAAVVRLVDEYLATCDALGQEPPRISARWPEAGPTPLGAASVEPASVEPASAET